MWMKLTDIPDWIKPNKQEETHLWFTTTLIRSRKGNKNNSLLCIPIPSSNQLLDVRLFIKWFTSDTLLV